VNGNASLLRVYWMSAVITATILAGVLLADGVNAAIMTATLVILEVTLSFDNAVVNSKLVGLLSPAWQRAFMTVGIFVAVFAVRFALPILIVKLTAGLGFAEVVRLAVDHPEQYGHELEKAAPMIDAFGGTFLLMIGLGFLLDAEKDTHWLAPIERRLAPLGRFDNLPIFGMVVGALVMFATVRENRAAVLVASVAGIALHVGLDMFSAAFDDSADGEDPATLVPTSRGHSKTVGLVGAAAAVMFLRLEILDASFSFDGVIGAFAITSSVLIIMAGLGAGAMWVRSMTVHLVRAGTLAKYRYLEHGAHWAILVLGAVMIAKLYGVHLPEVAVGSIGLVAIGAAVASSVVAQRREARTRQPAERELVNA
jgi:hypothetical protein